MAKKMHAPDHKNRSSSDPLRRHVSSRPLGRAASIAAALSFLTHLNVLSAPQAERKRPLPDTGNPLGIKQNHASQKPSEGKTHIHFNETINLFESDLLKKSSETQEEEACFPTQEPSKTSLPELFEKAEACHDKAQEELEKAYKAGEWQKAIRASKSAISAIEWRNSLNTRESTPITGIGVAIEQDKESGETRVINIINDSPADKGGIRKGDIIAKVDKDLIRDLSIIQTVELIKGVAGSEVHLTIKRDNTLIEKRIVRAALSGSPTTVALGREYGILHHAYFKLEKVEEARTLYPRARKEIASEFGASSNALLDLLYKQALLVLWKYPNEVEPLVADAIEILEHQNTPDKIQELWGMYNLAGYSLLEAGENEKAEKYIDMALDYYKEKNIAYPALSEGLARNVTLLAVFCKYSSIANAKCKGYSDIAYQMAVKHLSPSQYEYRRALWLRAERLSETGPVESWLPMYKQVIKLEEKHENLNTRATTLTALAMKLATIETNEAARLQSKAVKLIEQQSGTQSFESLIYQLKVADIYRFGGLQNTAYVGYLEIYKKLLQISEVGQYADGQRLKIYAELTKGLMPLGKTKLVGTLLNNTVEISAKYPGEVSAQLAGALAKANYSAFINRDHAKAIAYYAEAEQAFNKLEGFYHEPTEQNQGWVVGIRQNEIQRARLGLYEDMAALQALAEDYAAASLTISNAIKYIDSQSPTNAWQLKYLYATLSRYQVGQDNLTAAEKSFEKALNLSLADKTESSFDESYLLAGGVSGLLRKPEAAYQYFLRFSNARAKNLSAKLWRNNDQSERIEIVDTGLIGSEYIFYNYGDNPLYAKAAMYARLNLHGLSAELEQKQASIANADYTVAQIIDTIQSLSKQMRSPDLSSQKQELLSKEIARNEGLLFRKIPSLEHKPTSIDEVAKSLPSNAVLIEFQRVSSYPRIDRVYPLDSPKDSSYIALSLDNQGSVRRFYLGEADSIDRSILQAVESLSSGHVDSAQLWAKAGALLLRPLREVLGSKSIVYISPDSEISRFPFAAADIFNPDGILQPGTQIRLVTTGRDIVRMTTATTIPKKAAVIANPTYSLQAGKQSVSKNAQSIRSAESLSPHKPLIWKALLATEKEGAEVSRLINAQLINKEMANEQVVKSLVSPIILHFASHAFFLEKGDSLADGNGYISQGGQLDAVNGIGLRFTRSPAMQIRSGIVLAGANDPPKSQELDGYLTADEIARLGWSGTELVVVSGCDSAVGVSRSGDGLYGLRRSIAVAGARSSLLSLWKVEDAATAEFMNRFYQRLKAGEGRSDALAAVQEEFRSGKVQSGTVVDWKEPYYWAAWQLVGDWRPIPGF